MSYTDILIIDDEDEAQQILIKVLGSISTEFSCTAFNDAEEALFKLDAGELPAVLNNVSDPKIIKQTKELGAWDYIVKPNTFSQLMNNLSSIFLLLFRGVNFSTVTMIVRLFFCAICV